VQSRDRPGHLEQDNHDVRFRSTNCYITALQWRSLPGGNGHKEAPVKAQRGDAEQTKAEIIAAARRLFADRGFLAVSVRDVAQAAGVTHGLVHHYYGTKENLITAVLESAVATSARVLEANPITPSSDSLDIMRRVLRHFFTQGRDTAILVARAELAGLHPEKLQPAGRPNSVSIMAKRFAELQAELQPEGPHSDPSLVSLCVGAALFGLITMRPWLMNSVGLASETFDDRLDEIIDIAVRFVGFSLGYPAEHVAG
jgi:AcrR family transcriptional regulator